MSHSYATLLSTPGYPLWVPEPYAELPAIYQRNGLQIGDVGVILADGRFDVLFNITQPPDHPLHLQTGVPNNFNPIQLSARDVLIVHNSHSAGQVVSSPSIQNLRYEPGVASSGDIQSVSFRAASSEGALLVLPDGSDCHDLRLLDRFVDEASRHALDWYHFVRQCLGRVISQDSLFLITGYHKARSWVAASFQGATGGSALLEVTRGIGGSIAAMGISELGWPLEWRAGPVDGYSNANHTVCIRGLKLTIADGLFGTIRQISVAKVGGPMAGQVLASNTTICKWICCHWAISVPGHTPTADGHPDKPGRLSNLAASWMCSFGRPLMSPIDLGNLVREVKTKSPSNFVRHIRKEKSIVIVEQQPFNIPSTKMKCRWGYFHGSQVATSTTMNIVKRSLVRPGEQFFCSSHYD